MWCDVCGMTDDVAHKRTILSEIVFQGVMNSSFLGKIPQILKKK